MIPRPPSVRYIATIAHVREVNLVGSADLAFWQNQLCSENLFPYNDDGKAELLISATELVWMGVRFREWTLSITVSLCAAADRRDAAFLICATNSSRLFARMERVFFRTPYMYGLVNLEQSFPYSMALIERGRIVFNASMDAATLRTQREEQVWEGAIFLPGKAGRAGDRLFFARLGGATDRYPYTPGRDMLAIHPPDSSSVLHGLVRSQFTGKAWQIRGDANHRRSRTYRRSQALLGGVA